MPLHCAVVCLFFQTRPSFIINMKLKTLQTNNHCYTSHLRSHTHIKASHAVITVCSCMFCFFKDASFNHLNIKTPQTNSNCNASYLSSHPHIRASHTITRCSCVFCFFQNPPALPLILMWTRYKLNNHCDTPYLPPHTQIRASHAIALCSCMFRVFKNDPIVKLNASEQIILLRYVNVWFVFLKAANKVI